MAQFIKTLKTEKNLIITIIIFAGFLRLWGIWHGYPYSFYPDEAHFVKRALSFGSGDLNPHWFHKPALLMYILFIEYGLMFVSGKIVGVWQNVNDFAVFYVINPGPFYIVGRCTIVLFSLGSVFLVYLTGKKLDDMRTGLIAALILTVSFGHVYVSKDIKADIPCGFFTIVSAYYLISFLKDKQWRNIFLSAVFAGIGTATKTYSIVMVVPIFIAVASMDNFQIFYQLAKKIKLVCYCFLLFFVSFFICSPYNVIDPLGRNATFKPFYSLYNKVDRIISDQPIDQKQVEENVAHNIENPEISIALYADAITTYLKILTKGVGRVAFLVAFAGLIYLIARRNKQHVIGLLLYPFLFAGIAIFTNPGYSEFRHQSVIYPFFSLIAAIGVTQLNRYFNDKYVWVFVLLLLYPVYGISLYNMGISTPDTRNIAKDWIETNIPRETKIVINENGPQLNKTPKQIHHEIQIAKQSDPNGQFTAHFSKYLTYQLLAAQENHQIGYEIDEIRLPWWKQKEESPEVKKLDSEHDRDMGNPLRPVGIYPFEYYVENQFKFIIVQSEEYQGFLDPESNPSKNFPSFHKFYSALFKNGTLIKEFNPYVNKTQGPVVKIIAIR